jgi:hypothetical protein
MISSHKIYIQKMQIRVQIAVNNQDGAKEIGYFGGTGIARPRKNKELLTGRAGRNAIEREDIERESVRWQRRKATIERLRGDVVGRDGPGC